MKEDEKVAKFLHIIEADITDEEEVLDAFQWITDNVENVDVLINSAEYIEKSSILGNENTNSEWDFSSQNKVYSFIILFTFRWRS